MGKGDESKSELEKDEIRSGNVSIILDSYNDIFSDFDPRSYEERALSDDFLSECKKAAIVKKEGFELRIMVPKSKRSLNDEARIRRRFRVYFMKHYNEKKNEIKKIKTEGMIWFLMGTMIMMLETLLFQFEQKLFFVMAQPAGWFFFWEGLDKVFITSKEKRPDFEFYRRISHARISFVSY
jgi:hypothetical protein